MANYLTFSGLRKFKQMIFSTLGATVSSQGDTITSIEARLVDNASKNLLQNNMATKTVSGITFTVNDDKSVTASGTSSDYTWEAYINNSVTLQPGVYELSGCPEGGSSTTYRLQAFAGSPSDPTLNYNDMGSGVEFMLTQATTLQIRILIKGTVSNLKFEPMITRQGVEAGYEAYYPSNVDISNAIGMKVNGTGTFAVDQDGVLTYTYDDGE